ncbi:MAG: cation-transporting P-type ATPase [Alphaproteobacteria bacterium]|nr:cation-transporting P-type ATPase [Alphaproteobacteria bacterium]
MNLSGLTNAQVVSSRQKYGRNEMPRPKLKSGWYFFAQVFTDKLNMILLVMMCMFVALAALGYGSVFEAIGIGVVLLVVAATTVATKLGGQRSAEELRIKSSMLHADVVRDGCVLRVDATDLVVGDIVILHAGEAICADGFVVDGTIAVNNSILNGESDECEKTPVPANYDYDRSVLITADSYTDAHSVFAGTTVLAGECKMCVSRIGAETENAKIMSSLHSVDQVKTTLQIQLDNLADIISKIGSVCAAVIFLVLLFVNIHTTGFSADASLLYMVFSALTVALTIFVAAVPEGLPFIIGIITSQNIATMIKNNILAKNPNKIPEAGNIQILCTDKTGTLTRGFLEPVHNFSGDGTDLGFDYDASNPLSVKFFQNIALTTGSAYDSENNIVGGNLTSRALFSAVYAYAKNISQIQSETQISKRIIFNSSNKFAGVRSVGGECYYLGAPDVILSHVRYCMVSDGTIVPLDHDFINKLVSQNASRAMRLVVTAIGSNWAENETLPDDLVFVSLIAMRDQVRDGVPAVVGTMRKSGIQVMMITGDMLDTARAIATDCGILSSTNDGAIAASELDKMSDESATDLLPRIKVIARATPETKLRIVKLAQGLDLCIGMCGDGTNDAPALKRADVGFAMGEGTDVCKESCDIIITDNNFLSIANCILLGRTFVHNVVSFLKFQLPINFALVILSILFPILFGVDAFTAVQILIINIVMDSLNSLAFGGEPGRPEYMSEPAAGKRAPLLTRRVMSQIAWTTFGFVCVFGVMELPFIKGIFTGAGVILSARFALLVIMAIVNGFCVRTDGFNLFARLRSNPMFIVVALGVISCTVLAVSFGGDVLQLAPLGIIQWSVIFGLSMLIIPINFVYRLFWHSRK